MSERILLKDINNEIWNRLLVEIPGLYKSKGTVRSIRSIINTYGIPATMLDIKEYGQAGDKKNSLYNYYDIDTFLYTLKFSGIEWISTNWSTEITPDQTPASVELFFIAEDFPSASLININDKIYVNLIKYNDSKSYFQINMQTGSLASDMLTVTSSLVNAMDGLPNHIVLQKAADDIYEFNWNKLLHNDTLQSETITIDQTGETYINNWDLDGTLYIGQDFIGNIFEVRLWSDYLQDFTVEAHAKFPQAVFSNTATGSYDDLIMHLSLNDPINHHSSSVHELQNEAYNDLLYDFSALQFVSWSNETEFPYQYESKYINTVARSIDTGVSSVTSNKVRIDENYIPNGFHLSPFNSVEKSVYKDRKDPFKIGIYLSPTNLINDDIIRHLGITDIGELIGDPRDRYKEEYSELDNLRNAYWSWGADKNSFSEYLDYVKSYDLKGLFSSIENLLPARSYAIVGILYEQTLLERQKLKRMRPSSRFTNLPMTVLENPDVEILTGQTNDFYFSINQNENASITVNNFNKSNIYNIIETVDFNTNISGIIFQSIKPLVNFETNIIWSNFEGNFKMSSDQIYDGSYSNRHYINYLGYRSAEKSMKYNGCINSETTTYDKLSPVVITNVAANKLYVNKTGRSNLEVN